MCGIDCLFCRDDVLKIEIAHGVYYEEFEEIFQDGKVAISFQLEPLASRIVSHGGNQKGGSRWVLDWS